MHSSCQEEEIHSCPLGLPPPLNPSTLLINSEGCAHAVCSALTGAGIWQHSQQADSCRDRKTWLPVRKPSSWKARKDPEDAKVLNSCVFTILKQPKAALNYAGCQQLQALLKLEHQQEKKNLKLSIAKYLPENLEDAP